MRQELLRWDHVNYHESGIVLLDDFSLNIFKGEIVGFIPVNDHGLSAFLHLLRINAPLEDGYIYYKEVLVNSWKKAEKELNRICIISDESSLIDDLSVADNIFIFRPNARIRIIDSSLLIKQLQPFLDDIHVSILAEARIKDLSVFERVIVEILKAVVGGYQLIVLSEISTLVSDAELSKLREIMRHYIRQGFSFLYISPHFEEMFQVCSSIALMLNGRIEKVFRKEEMKADLLLSFTTAYDELVRQRFERKRDFSMDSAHVFEVQSETPDFLCGLSFSVAKGECLVIQALDKRIDDEILNTYYGENISKKGTFFIDGEEIHIERSRDVAFIQEVPGESMLFPDLSILDNLCFTVDHRVKSIWARSSIKKSIILEYGDLLGRDVFEKKIEELSESQKIRLVYARVRLQKPKVVFCIQPFKGADLKHRMLIWEQINGLLERGIAVVIFAVNLADSLSLADRLIRVSSDNTVRIYSRNDFGNIPISAPWLYLYKEKPSSEEK